MRDFANVIQSVTEMAQAHKPTILTIFAGLFTSLVNAFDMIPAEGIARLTGFLTAIVALCLANYHRKNTEKVKKESYKLDLEAKILEMQIQREQADLEQRRRRDDK